MQQTDKTNNIQPAQTQTSPCASLLQVRPAINIPARNTEGVFTTLLPGSPPPALLWNLPALFAFGCDSTLTPGPRFLSFDPLTFLNCKVTQPEESSQ